MPGIFTETSVAIISPLQAIWVKIIENLPDLVAAAIVLIIGCFVAVILGHALRVVLEKLKLDDDFEFFQLHSLSGPDRES